jgi:hypothetical protein
VARASAALTLPVALIAGATLAPVIAPALVLADTPEQANARALLVASSQAIKANPGLTFKAKRTTDLPGFTVGGEGALKTLRGGTPVQFSFSGKGRLDVPGLPTPDFHFAMIEGARTQWIDDNRKALIDRPVTSTPPVPDGATQAGRVQQLLIPPVLFDAEPFTDELRQFEVDGKMTSMAMSVTGSEAVGGVDCDVVRVVIKEGQTERRVWIAKTDKLPRKYEQARVNRGRVAQVWELTDLTIVAGMKPSDIELVAPAGYAVDRQTTPPASAIAPANPAGPIPRVTAPAPSPMGGPQIGQVSPDISGVLVAPAGGTQPQAPFDMKSLAGKPAVITFFSPLFPRSLDSLQAAAAAASGLEAGKVTFVQVGTRSELVKPEAMAAALGGAASLGPAVRAEARTIEAFSLRAFPTTVVLSAEGKVAAVFEGPVTPEQITGAVTGKN